MRAYRAGPYLAAALLPMGGTAAAQQLEVDLDVVARASASDNPLLSTGSDTAAILGEFRLEPSVRRESPTTSMEVSGRIVHRQYSRRYGSETFGGAEWTSTARLSERLQFSGAARHSRDLAVDSFDDVTAAIDPRSLRVSSSASLGAGLTLSETESLSANTSISRSRFVRSETLRGYDSFGGGLGYVRALSERLSVGGRAQASFQRYETSSDSRVVSAAGTVNYRIDETTTLSGGLGLEWVTLDGLGSLPDSEADLLQFGGDARVCRRRLRMNLCVNAQLSSDATGIGRLQRRASVGVSYTYQASERTSYSADVAYQRSSDLVEDVVGSLSYLSARGSVQRDIGRALELGGFAQYRHRSGFGNASAVLIGAELRWNWGRFNGRD